MLLYQREKGRFRVNVIIATVLFSDRLNLHS